MVYLTTTILEQPLTVPSRSRQAFSAFGNVHMFAGRRFDDRMGLYYYRNRYCDPRSGRFVSRDPYVQVPQRYAHTQNNPVNRIDPLGLDFQDLGWKWGTPKGGVKARVFPYYRVRLGCECDEQGYYRIKFLGADVRVRTILNEKTAKLRLRSDYEAIQRGQLRDRSGNSVSTTALSYENVKGETVPTALGVYGHEMKHSQSIEAAYDRAMAEGSKLENAIAKMEARSATRKPAECAKDLKTWQSTLEQLQKEAIDEGAGHDADDATTKPEGGRTYEPPGTTMPDPETEWDELTTGPEPYTQYPVVDD